MPTPKPVTAYKLSVERRLETIKRWLEVEKGMGIVIDAGLANPGKLPSSTLRAIADGLTNTLNIMKLTSALVEEADQEGFEIDLDVDQMWADLKSKWAKIQKLVDYEVAFMKADPLKMKAQTMQSLTSLSRKSLTMLALIEAQEMKEAEEIKLAESGGLTPDEVQLMQEWDGLKEELRLDEYAPEFDRKGDEDA